MNSSLKEHFSSLQLIPTASRILVGVSGGVDSILLAVLLQEAGYQVRIAHVNYGLRGSASDSDENLVRMLASRLNLGFHVLNVSESTRPDTSLQAWARVVRYEWFESLCALNDIQFVAVAHHADDQLETMLLNLARGTSVAGLAAMPDSRPLSRYSEVSLVRPLLSFTRAEIEAEAGRRTLAWREDESNSSPIFERSALRTELREMSSSEYASFREAGMALSDKIGAFRRLLRSSIEERGTVLSLAELNTLPGWIATWLVMEMIEHLDPFAPRRSTIARSVLDLVGSQVGKRVELESVRAWRERDHIVMERILLQPDQTPSAVHRRGNTIRESGRLVCKEMMVSTDGYLATDQKIAYLDSDMLQDHLSLRCWTAGDRFYPLGMDGSKKLKSFLTDEGVAASEKKNVLVLLSGGRIAWVVGHRIDDRFKVTPSTKRVLRCEWIEKREETVNSTRRVLS